MRIKPDIRDFEGLIVGAIGALGGILGGILWSDWTWGKRIREGAERGEPIYNTKDGRELYVPVRQIREGAERGESIYADGRLLYEPATSARGRGEYDT